MMVAQHKSSGGLLVRNRGAAAVAGEEKMTLAKEIAWERRAAVTIQSKVRGTLARRASKRLKESTERAKTAKLEASRAGHSSYERYVHNKQLAVACGFEDHF